MGDDAIRDMRRVRKPATYNDLGPVDISALLPVVQRISERTWQAEDEVKENDFAVFHHTQHFVLRFTPDNADPRVAYSNPSWAMWKTLLLPVMDTVTQRYGHQEVAYSKAMFARLRAGSYIDPHVDGRGSNLVSHKVHVPLVTNPDAIFFIMGEPRHLEVGQAYEVNNIVRHAVKNGGDQDRIHFIFEHYDAAASPKSQPNEPQVSP